MRYSRSKLELSIGFLWQAQTRTANKDYFTKKLSQTFKKCSLENLENSFGKNLKKLNYKNFIKKNNKTVLVVVVAMLCL